LNALTYTHTVVYADLPQESIPVNVIVNHREVITRIMQASSGGIQLSELPQKFEVSGT